MTGRFETSVSRALRDKAGESGDGKSPGTPSATAQRASLQAGLVSSFTGQSPSVPIAGVARSIGSPAVDAAVPNTNTNVNATAPSSVTAPANQVQSPPVKQATNVNANTAAGLAQSQRGFEPRKEQPVDDADGDDEDDEDEMEEEEEPKLKYQRLGFSVEEILRTKQVSSFLAHDKFLAVGTKQGSIYLLDMDGDQIQSFTHHNSSVNCLSADSTGEFIASCGDDGRVVIASLVGGDNHESSFSLSLKAVAVDPDYAKKSTRFCTGGLGGKLHLNSKGWLMSKSQIIHQGEGSIYAVKWRGNLIAWGNDQGVKIYDTVTNQRISNIDRGRANWKPDQFPCHLCWENDNTLLIGWGNSITIASVKERKPERDMSMANMGSGIGSSTRFAEIVQRFETEYPICGVCPFNENIVILAYIIEERDGQKVVERPDCKILSRSGDEISSDALPIIGFERYKPNDYKLDYIQSENMYYIISPSDIVFARQRDLDDHITWLHDKGRYQEAWESAEPNAKLLKQHTLIDIGQKYLADLLTKQKKPTVAASLCPRILQRDKNAWEKWVWEFVNSNALQDISPFIPTSNPALDTGLYEMVLGTMLRDGKYEELLRTIREWPHTLYNTQTIITAIEKALDVRSVTSEAVVLSDSLYELYTYVKQYEKAFQVYLRLRRPEVFQLIRTHNLYYLVKDRVIQLMEFNEELTIKLLTDNVDKIPIDGVVKQLSSTKYHLHLYLHALFLRDPHIASDYHGMQVELYAQYDYQMLLPFLKTSNSCPLEQTYQIVEKKCLYPEMVFILGRMGNNKQALHLLIDKIKDVHQAIEFVQSQDSDLWEDLINLSINNPVFVSGLLETIGAHVDPILLIKRIPNGMEIDGLKQKLVKIISDYHLQMSLRKGCSDILKSDCVALSARLTRGQRMGVRCNDASKCSICNNTILVTKEDSGEVVVFNCKHYYHQSCLMHNYPASLNPRELFSKARSIRTLWCTICQNSQKPKDASGAPGSVGSKRK